MTSISQKKAQRLHMK